ncbi:Trk-type K+ transport system membrane component [Paeniglutamicibacter psychrophenolicus]|nr:Trk-type K+ transport system membrane component [Paeniglutamicibacter psychrophenolicus]
MRVAAMKYRPSVRALLPRHPAQAIALGFGLAVAVGTAILMLPMAKTGPGGATFLEALFTATSAVCVTGLAVVDTATYWTRFGQVVILVLIQLGGFGIMSFASLLGVLMARRLGLRSRIQAAAETKAPASAKCVRCCWGSCASPPEQSWSSRCC